MDAATSNPLLQALDRLMTKAEARMPDPLHPIHAVRAGNLIPTQIDNTADLVLMLDDYCESVRKDDEDDRLWVRILATVERAQNEREQMLEAATCVLSVLSLLAPEIERMGCGSARAVEKFRKAVQEAQS